jgi:hypothetical protein
LTYVNEIGESAVGRVARVSFLNILFLFANYMIRIIIGVGTPQRVADLIKDGKG